MGHIYDVNLIKSRVTPDDDPADSGILVEGSLSLPFTVERSWSGPSGYYMEQFQIRSGDTVLYQSAPLQTFVRGVQSLSSYRTHVGDRFSLEPGNCQLVFLLDDVAQDAVEVPVKAVAAV